MKIRYLIPIILVVGGCVPERIGQSDDNFNVSDTVATIDHVPDPDPYTKFDYDAYDAFKAWHEADHIRIDQNKKANEACQKKYGKDWKGRSRQSAFTAEIADGTRWFYNYYIECFIDEVKLLGELE